MGDVQEIRVQLERVEQGVTGLRKALLGSTDPGAPAGLIVRVARIEERLIVASRLRWILVSTISSVVTGVVVVALTWWR